MGRSEGSGALPSEFFISARHQAVCVSMATRYSRISMEHFHRAYDLLISKSRPRVRQNPMAVYAGILICDNCGSNMSANGSFYCCTTYLNKGGPLSGCTHNKIASNVIDQYVNSWLEETNQTLAWTDTSDPITSLYKTSDINNRSMSLLAIVEHYLADKLAQVFPYDLQSDGSRIFEIPGQEIVETADDTEIVDTTNRIRLLGYDGSPSYLQELLGTVEASVNAGLVTQIAAWEARKLHLLNIYPEADNKSLRERLLREINAIDSQIDLARQGVTDYAMQHRELIAQLHEMWRASKHARDVKIPLARRKALMTLIAEIRCKFVRVVKGKTRLVSVLGEISIIPEIGDAYVVRTACASASSVPGRSPEPGTCPASGGYLESRSSPSATGTESPRRELPVSSTFRASMPTGKS